MEWQVRTLLPDLSPRILLTFSIIHNTTASIHAPYPVIPTSYSPVGPGTPTAQDLLQGLMLGGNPSPSHHTPTLPSLPRQNSQPPTAKGSPGMLFGGDVNGSSIWTMTREESGRGGQRGPAPGPGVNLANIWSDQTTPPPHQAIGGQPSSGPMGANSPAGAPGQGWARASGGSAALGGADWGAAVRKEAYAGPPGNGTPTGQAGNRKTGAGAHGWNGARNGQPAGYSR